MGQNLEGLHGVPDFFGSSVIIDEFISFYSDIETVLDGRRSFPSGHSSTAFAGMSFLSLWIAGMTGAWCIGQPAPARSFLASKLGRLTISIMPLVFATWVAVSRIEDNVCPMILDFFPSHPHLYDYV